MARELELVTNLEQVKENAVRFSKKIKNAGGTYVYRQLGRFIHWYYFKDLGVLAPSKFIGYVGTTVKNYKGGGQSERHGSLTEPVLREWFREIDPENGAEASHRWQLVLNNYLQGLGKKRRKDSRVHILKDEFDELCGERRPNVWMVRGMSGRWTPDFLEHGYVGFHLKMEGIDMSGCKTQEEVRELYGEHNQTNTDPKSIGSQVSQIWAFINEVNDGDYVLTADDQRTIHYGIVGDIEYMEDGRPCSNRRPVSWKGTIERLGRLQRKTVFKLSGPQRNAVFEQIGRVDLVGGHTRAIVGASTKDDADQTLGSLASELLLDPGFLEEIRTLLEDKRQIIFQGPPGTGKTYVARKLAERMAGSPDRVTIVQFHPSYAYEDFVQGFRPTMLDQGQAGFKVSNGPLLEAAKRAKSERDSRHFLIIDEINRGNLAKVFGELYFLLEYRNEKIRLQYGGNKKFRLPRNLYIIGTMNTADRSIALVDLALRRRFYFVSFDPREEPVAGLLGRWLADRSPGMEWVAQIVAEANRRLDSRHAAIGPSYFMKEGLDEDAVERIWKHSVMPYIEEHLFGEPDRVEEFKLQRLRNQSSEDGRVSTPADELAGSDEDE